MQIEEIYKRNHLKKPFLIEKITEAILKAMQSVGEGSNDEAENISERIGEGENFAKLAVEFSTGPSASNGGSLGWFSTGQMVPEFEAAVLALEIGMVSRPIKTQFGWHIIKLDVSVCNRNLL